MLIERCPHSGIEEGEVDVIAGMIDWRLFGWLSAFAMVAPLVADIFILRPTAMWLINLSQRLRGDGRSREGGRVNGRTALTALRHRDIDAPDLALGADLHRLLVAGGPQLHAGGKSRSLDEHFL
jgi:hypothetical protein